LTLLLTPLRVWQDSKLGELDLHGLYVKEAIYFTDLGIQEARRRGDAKVHLIVGMKPLSIFLAIASRIMGLTAPGKGLHSPHGAAKLKPAIEDLMKK